jgi:protein STE50
MSPTYRNGINDERRPESPRSPTKSVIPITPGLQPPTPYGSSYTPSPESSSAQGGAFSNTTSASSYASAYTPTASYTTSPVTPRRERKEDENDTATPRNRSNSATEKEIEKETRVTTSTSRSEDRTRPSREGRSKDGASNPMKSFRVNLDDPCWKVLPAAMKKYDVKGREEDYRLYITYGDIGIFSHARDLTCRTETFIK